MVVCGRLPGYVTAPSILITMFIYFLLLLISPTTAADGPNKRGNGQTSGISVICEGGKSSIQCDNYEQIQIITAFWGRDNTQTCPLAPPLMRVDRLCATDTENTIRKVKAQCDIQQACELVASNIFFDDQSCGDVYKYLKIDYSCKSASVDVILARLLQLQYSRS